jgi:plastocyanin
MRKSWRWGAFTALGAVSLFAVVVVIFPALAGSATTPTIEAVAKTGVQYSNEAYSWTPEQVTTSPGGTVAFKANAPGSQHGIVWKEVPTTPTCNGVPVNAGGEGWSGSCTFSQAGSYTFYCYVHPEMHGVVVVSGNTVFTTAQTATSEHKEPGENSSSPFAGGASKALVLSKSQHGTAVKGSLALTEAGARGKLTIELLLSRALAAKGHKGGKASVVVGKYVHPSTKSGVLSFSVALNSAGKRALKKHHSLPLSVKLSLQPNYGVALKMSRPVTLHG